MNPLYQLPVRLVRFCLPLLLLLLLAGPPVSAQALTPNLGYAFATGVTTRVSVASDGAQANGSSFLAAISANKRYVAFYSLATNLVSGDTNGTYDVFVHDQLTAETARVSVASDNTQGNSSSEWPSISASGRYVAFTSYASNLVGDDTNGVEDVFVHDRLGAGE